MRYFGAGNIDRDWGREGGRGGTRPPFLFPPEPAFNRDSIQQLHQGSGI